MSKRVTSSPLSKIKDRQNVSGEIEPGGIVVAPSSQTEIAFDRCENEISVDCDHGLVAIAFEISRQRRDTLLQLMDALDQSDWTKAKTLARRLCGNEKSD